MSNDSEKIALRESLRDLRAEHSALVEAVEQDEYLLRKLASGEWRVKMTSGSSSGMKNLATILLALLPQDGETEEGEDAHGDLLAACKRAAKEDDVHALYQIFNDEVVPLLEGE